MAKKAEKTVNAPPKVSAEPIPQASSSAITKAVSAPSAILTGAPEWLQKAMAEGEGVRGLEVMDSTDLILPRLVLAQALHPEVQKEGLFPAGTLFDNLTKEVLLAAPKPGQPPPTLEIIPVVLGKSRIYFKPMKDGGGMLCRADDAILSRAGGAGRTKGDQPTRNCVECVFKDWTEENGQNEKPKCSIFYGIIVLLPSRGMRPYVWSNKHTNVKGVKRFLSAAKQTGADFFAQKHALFTKLESNPQYSWFNFDFKPVGWVSQDEYKHGEQFYNSLKGKTWAADVSDLEEEVAAEGSASEGVPPPPATPAGQEEEPF